MSLYEKMCLILKQENICGLPLWLYDHSGISMSTGRVDKFDSSLVGIIFVEKETFFAQTCRKDDCDWNPTFEVIADYFDFEVASVEVI